MALFEKKDLEKLRQKAADLYNKAVDQQVTLAVTGLSRSGKTAFITSLVNQLINQGNGTTLNFFNPVHEGRFVAAKRVPQQNVHVSRFNYDKAMSAFTQQPAQWPEPTQGISEIRLAIKYRPNDSLLKYASDFSTLYVNITDYPGEWLLDLPMLSQSFEEWSLQMTQLLQQAPRDQLSAPFLTKMKQIDPWATGSEEVLAELASDYTALLHRYRHEFGLSVIQPGRFILPGDLKDAPILQFVPYPYFGDLDQEAYQDADNHSIIGMLRSRFLEYKERVVKAFYRQHFMHFDRQIVLADCLTPLNQGQKSFKDLQLAIELIMASYHYGKSSLLTRLFAPKIDKLLFAATKADHVTADQHSNLVSLMEQLVYSAKKRIEFEHIDITAMAIASVKATQSGIGQHNGEKIPVIHGRRKQDQQPITLYPGSVPKNLPDQDYWQQHQFNFVEFLPNKVASEHEALAQIRLDQVLQYLLGDKMK